jgi:hypothetical protein
VFDAGAVAGERFAAIAFVHGSIECGVGGGEGGRHRQRVVRPASVEAIKADPIIMAESTTRIRLCQNAA